MLNFLSELQEPPLHFRIFRKPFNVNQNCAMHDDKLHTVPRLELLGNLHQILFQRRDWTFGIASRYGDSENPEDSPFGFVLLLLLDSRWLVSYRCCAARIVLRLFQTLQTLKPWSCLKTLWKQRFDSYRLMIHSLNPIPHNSANSSTLEFLHKVFESLLQALQSKHRSIFVGGDAELQFDICSIDASLSMFSPGLPTWSNPHCPRYHAMKALGIKTKGCITFQTEDSAGGNLALEVARKASEEAGPNS